MRWIARRAACAVSLIKCLPLAEVGDVFEHDNFDAGWPLDVHSNIADATGLLRHRLDNVDI